MIARRLRALSKRQAFPTGIRAQQLSTLSGVINGVGMFVILFSAMIQILGVLNIDVKPLIASAGVVGLAIGFGAQTLVKDLHRAEIAESNDVRRRLTEEAGIVRRLRRTPAHASRRRHPMGEGSLPLPRSHLESP